MTLATDPLICKVSRKGYIREDACGRQHPAPFQINPYLDLWLWLIGCPGIQLDVDRKRLVDIVMIQLLTKTRRQQRSGHPERDSLRIDGQEERIGLDRGKKAAREDKWITVNIQPGFIRLQDMTAQVIRKAEMTRQRLVPDKAAFFHVEGKAPEGKHRRHLESQNPVLPVDNRRKPLDGKIEQLMLILSVHHPANIGKDDG